MAELDVRERALLLLHLPELSAMARLDAIVVSSRVSILKRLREELEQHCLSRMRRARETVAELRAMELDVKYLQFVADDVGVTLESPGGSVGGIFDKVPLKTSSELRILAAMHTIAALHKELHPYVTLIDRCSAYIRRREHLDRVLERRARTLRAVREDSRARIGAELTLQGKRSENLTRLDSSSLDA